jgi:hypothetical protein
MRKLIISLAAAAAITAAAAGPALAQPPDPCQASAHIAAIVWHPGGGCQGAGCQGAGCQGAGCHVY